MPTSYRARSNRLQRAWRPKQAARTPCGFTFRGSTCKRRGSHYCEQRGDKVVAFFKEVLVHTKGLWAHKAFDLLSWQEWDIIRPLFGEVLYDGELKTYLRRYRLAWIVLGRKNGKSELVAAIVLYLLIGDNEVGAEVYGAAKDTKQAGKVGEVVNRMRELSSLLNGDPPNHGRLKRNKSTWPMPASSNPRNFSRTLDSRATGSGEK